MFYIWNIQIKSNFYPWDWITHKIFATNIRKFENLDYQVRLPGVPKFLKPEDKIYRRQGNYESSTVSFITNPDLIRATAMVPTKNYTNIKYTLPAVLNTSSNVCLLLKYFTHYTQ